MFSAFISKQETLFCSFDLGNVYTFEQRDLRPQLHLLYQEVVKVDPFGNVAGRDVLRWIVVILERHAQLMAGW
jgi:hypothetical protein